MRAVRTLPEGRRRTRRRWSDAMGQLPCRSRDGDKVVVVPVVVVVVYETACSPKKRMRA